MIQQNDSSAEELKIVFKNASGIECLKTVIASKSTTLDINSLSNGVYFYEISDGSRFLKSAKIVVIK